MPIQSHTKSDVQMMLGLLQQRVNDQDLDVMRAISTSAASTGQSTDAIRAQLASDLDKAISSVQSEQFHDGEDFHSRNPLAALSQAHFNSQANEVKHNAVGDALPAVVNLFGEGNPIVWAPVMVNIFLEHLKKKADFITATDEKSYVNVPDKCSIALLGDWGADNDHAQRISDLVRQRKPDYAVHLGDIYYAGSEYECERFIANWPLKAPKTSFALNGNHEMYSRGIPYFNTVLPAFGQEASYFTLHNNYWQIHGLDTAYVPFSIDGQVAIEDHPSFWAKVMSNLKSVSPFVDHDNFDRKPDGRLQAQWDWLQSKIVNNSGKKNIFLSHNQPVSAYLPEFQASVFLLNEFWKLRETIPGGMHSVWAWFFGHEHKCTIYDDTKTEFRARLVGNGAIPHSKQALVAAAKDETQSSCTPVFTMNNRVIEADALGIDSLALAISSFALLTLDGPDAYVEYINEDGSLFLREKLSGKPNEVLEWGEGYEQLAADPRSATKNF